MLLRTCSLEELIAQPIGARFRASHFSYLMPTEGLAMAIAVGRFDVDAFRDLVPLLEAIRSLPRHRSLWDVSRVEDVSADAFVKLQQYFRDHFRDSLPVERVAVVAPPSGPLRAAAAGMFAFLEPPYAVSAFLSLDEALGWLEAGAAHVDLVTSEAAALAAASFEEVVSAWLDAHLTTANVKRCARDLGVSIRTLQRRLAASKTAFDLEANRARVRTAERLLATDATLTHIAFEAGFSSPQRFASVFRKLTGVSPTQARARIRRHSPT